MTREPRGAAGERGFTTIQYVIAVAWSFVMLVLVANLMVDLYARGAVRDALDDGVRAGASAVGPGCRVRGAGARGRVRPGARSAARRAGAL